MSTPDSPHPASPDATPITPPAYAPPAYAPPAYGQPPAPAEGAYGAQAPGAYPPPAYPGYGAPAGYGAYAYGYPQQRTNVLAIISLVSSVLGLILVPFLGSIAGAVTGHIALRQISRNGEGGRGMALAGVIIGWIALALWALLIVGLFGLAFWSTSASYTTYS